MTLDFLKRSLNLKELWPERLSPAVAALILAVGLFLGIVADLLARGRLLHLDAQVFSLLSWSHSPILTALMTGLSWLGHRYGISAVVAVMVVWLYWKKQWGDLLVLFLAYAGGGLVVVLLQAIYQRPRPLALLSGAGDYSFPSASVFAFTAIYGFFTYLVWRDETGKKWKITVTGLVLFLMLGVGASRVYLQAHWLSDVLAGYLCGFAWLLLSIQVVRAMVRRKIFNMILSSLGLFTVILAFI